MQKLKPADADDPQPRKYPPKPRTHIPETPEQKQPDQDFRVIWECPNCGQTFFGQYPPDLCDFCRDFTTWRKKRE